MKAIIFIMLIGSTFLSCSYYNNTPYDIVKDPKKETTVYEQLLPKDTMLVSVDGPLLYVFDDDNNLVIKTKTLGEGYVPIHITALTVIIISLLLFFGSFIVALFD
jgi:hypothetical protein